LSAFVLLSLLISTFPYILFSIHSLSTPLGSSHAHLVDSSASIAQATGFVLCAFFHVEWLPFVCRGRPPIARILDTSPEISRGQTCRELRELVFRRGELYADLSSGPTLLRSAVRLAILEPTVMGIVAHLQDHHTHEGEPVEQVSGDAGASGLSVLPEIATLCHAIMDLTYELMLHVEVAMLRALLLNLILEGGLYIDRLKRVVFQLPTAHSINATSFVSLSANATLDSLNHIQSVASRVHALTSSLAKKFKSLPTEIELVGICSGNPRTLFLAALCEDVASLYRGAHDIRTMLEELGALEATLNEGILNMNSTWMATATDSVSIVKCPIWLLSGMLDGDVTALGRMIRDTRSAVDKVVP
ncbi:hypothetical protein FKP32DRAFT_1536230, partial [Trametes sanguinea]